MHRIDADDGNVPVGEWDPDAEEFRWFIRGLGIAEGTGDVIAEVDPDGTSHYYVANHRGDTVAVIDEDSVKEAEIEYDAFGNIIEQTGTFTPRFTFSTKEYLPEAKLYLYAYRVYDRVAGRWTQRDPLDYYDSPNLYQFCGNDPVNRTDADGQGYIRLTTMLFKGAKGGFLSARKAMASGANTRETIRAGLSGAAAGMVDYAAEGMAVKDPIVAGVAEGVKQLGEGKLHTKEGLCSVGSETLKSATLLPVVEYVPIVGTAVEAVEMLYYASPFPDAMQQWGEEWDELFDINRDVWREMGKHEKEEQSDE